MLTMEQFYQVRTRWARSFLDPGYMYALKVSLWKKNSLGEGFYHCKGLLIPEGGRDASPIQQRNAQVDTNRMPPLSHAQPGQSTHALCHSPGYACDKHMLRGTTVFSFSIDQYWLYGACIPSPPLGVGKPLITVKSPLPACIIQKV